MIKKIWYQYLGHLPHLHSAFDRKVKNPQATIIFLHGIAASSKTWLPALHAYANIPALQNTRLIAFDWLGFGKSLHANWLKYTFRENIDALHRSLKRLRVRGPIILVGHSMGALIATRYASRYKISHLLLVSPPLILPEEIARVPDKFYLQTFSSVDTFAKTPAGKALSAFADQLSSFQSQYLHTPAFSRSMKNIILNKSNYANLIHLDTPTTIIHGRFDPLVIKANLVQASQHNPHCRLICINARHDISPTKQSQILKILQEVILNETL